MKCSEKNISQLILAFINQFEKDIVFNGERYVTRLPFKVDHDLFLDNFKICEAGLINLKRKLADHNFLKEYNEIIKDYESKKIIERVPKNEIYKKPGEIHYLPIRPVIREEKDTTKISDASFSTNGPSGPNLLTRIFDILLIFRFNSRAILEDIKQAFPNIDISKEHRDYLCFLWYDVVASENEAKPIIYRFI